MLSQPTPARTSAITDIPDVAAARGIALADQSAARTQRIRAPSEAGAARIGRLPAFAPVRLAAIARSRPRDSDALAQVPGIGVLRAENYGADVLALVASSRREDGAALAAASAS